MNRSSLLGAIGAVALGLPALAQAAVVISPVSAVVNSGGEAGAAYGIGNTFDQSGLSEGYQSGVTDFDAFLASDPQHSASGAFREWFAAPGATSATVTYDLGGFVELSSLALWNEEAGGVGRLRVYAMDQLIAELLPEDTPGGVRFYGAQRFDFGAITTRFVTFEMDGCPQGDGAFAGCSLGEVAFGGVVSAVPEPATWLTLTLGVFGLGGLLRRASGTVRPTIS